MADKRTPPDRAQVERETESAAGPPHTLGALLDACGEVHHPRTYARVREEFGRDWCRGRSDRARSTRRCCFPAPDKSENGVIRSDSEAIRPEKAGPETFTNSRKRRFSAGFRGTFHRNDIKFQKPVDRIKSRA
ncbi:hypothetical protein AB2M62_01490 [Sphingomonas sp. MMS12-HWE2-04]|uniref:hypothetical protein n=1 Tax=Sphingomonas sp. MMS12-HWE2-04 TaxID=3234199 RepID=UPI003850614D